MTIDARILQAMRCSGETGVSGGDLSSSLGISRAAIWARIEELRSLGYDIQASPHQGYRLLSSPDLLHADDLMARLTGAPTIGRDIRVFEKTTSTNEIAEKLARDGAAEGVVVFAEAQTAGRGRLGRRWESAGRKGLWFSTLLRPPWRPQAATRLTVAAASALARAIASHTGLRPSIKWPNDLLVNGKKISGILTELSAELDSIKSVVLGIGVNVNQVKADFPGELQAMATSLRIESGQQIDRAGLAADILQSLDHDYQRLLRGEFDAIATEWESRCGGLGQQVQIRIGDRIASGRAEALDEDGALLLRTEHGRIERIVGGDVTVEKRA